MSGRGAEHGDQLIDLAGAKPSLVWKEAIGRLHAQGSHINLSDGGHIENLGVLRVAAAPLPLHRREYIRAYRSENPNYPHETTADQLFSEAQFEAYRALGEHIGEDLLRDGSIDEIARYKTA